MLLRETMGVSAEASTRAFPEAAVSALMTKPRIPPASIATIYLAIDPASGGHRCRTPEEHTANAALSPCHPMHCASRRKFILLHGVRRAAGSWLSGARLYCMPGHALSLSPAPCVSTSLSLGIGDGSATRR